MTNEPQSDVTLFMESTEELQNLPLTLEQYDPYIFTRINNTEQS